MKKKPIIYLLGLLILLMSLAACGGNEEPTAEPETAVIPTTAPDPTDEPTAEPTTEPTQAPTAEPTIAPTVAPTAEPTDEPDPTATPVLENETAVITDGLTPNLTPDQISLDSDALGEEWFATLVPATAYNAGESPGPLGLPEHIAITFGTDDPASRAFGDPIMYIIPVEAYKALWEDAGSDSVSNMMDSIAQMAADLPNPAPTSGMPVLPYEEIGGFNDVAAQVATIAAEPNSATQEGYRFVGRFGQSPNPVTNWQLRYIYQGFTTDGEYLVSFFYPVRTDALPDEVGTVMLDEFEADMTGHMDDSIAMLNELETSDWEPDLAILDAVVASLQIEGMEGGMATEEALPTTLPTEITAQSWQWVSFTDPVSGTQAVNAPAQYQLTLNDDGTLNLQADCNSGNGTYTVDGSSIAITLGAMTKVACPPDSLADDFLRNLEAAAIYFMQDGDLFFDLMYDSGTMRLTAVTTTDTDSPESTDGSGITPESIQMDTQGLASSWAWEVVGGSAASNGPGGAPATSSYIMLTFDGADVETTLAEGLPHIAIFPVESYIAAGGERVENEVIRLQELIDGAEAADPMPLLPPPSSFMGRWAQFANLDFADGAGVRYVSEAINRQAIGPWVNDGTAYYYQGLTEDGRFYVSLVWPVRTDSLPDTTDDVPEETMAAATSPDTYDAYLIDTQNMLNLLPSSAWEPNLADLDAMVNSLKLYE